MVVKRGFQFDETMSGTYALVETPDEHRPLWFSVLARADSFFRYLSDQRIALQGTLDAVGFADHVPVEGTMLLSPIGKRIIRYEFNFTGNDGQPYHFAGQKDIALRSPIRTFTELPAEIRDRAGKLAATSRTQFDLRSDWLQFLLSWRRWAR